MLYSIIFTVCWTLQPMGCTTHERMVTLSPMPTTAHVQAQAYLAQWLNEHPGWKLAPKWRLEIGRGA